MRMGDCKLFTSCERSVNSERRERGDVDVFCPSLDVTSNTDGISIESVDVNLKDAAPNNTRL